MCYTFRFFEETFFFSFILFLKNCNLSYYLYPILIPFCLYPSEGKSKSARCFNNQFKVLVLPKGFQYDGCGLKRFAFQYNLYCEWVAAFFQYIFYVQKKFDCMTSGNKRVYMREVAVVLLVERLKQRCLLNTNKAVSLKHNGGFIVSVLLSENVITVKLLPQDKH